ncbi:hypothetical protein CONLIGDRAFT_682461 [Coniochaeta ligniaria NRRL 30616]|uniref:Stc1 domain-containing protein n=1 Tax=Coniochaeta ligniaria NRRL 30616 TaxID=1408157 RepID=A0A1J7IIX3_9PEZI|nr:hypothetical protein CONLIGDRAFT_682461 [Coniochaeta ligniaria NRRL 30616]
MSFWESKRDLTNLPPKIRCDVGKEWKTPEMFSKNKLRQFSDGLRRTKRVTAANSGIACRVHSGEPETMLKCDGPCGKTYGLQNFSRNTRVRGVYWCNDCTEWQCKNEAGYMPYPVPYAPRSEQYKSKAQIVQGVANGEDMRDGSIADDVSSIAPSFTPSGITTEHSVGMSADFGGPDGSSAVPTGEGSIYSDHPRGAGGPQQFNAWGPDGVMHRVTKAPTVVSEVSTKTAKSEVTVTPSGWVKPRMRKTPNDVPDYIRFGRCNPTIDDDYHSEGGSEDEI